MSIHPEYAEAIMAGRKRVEFRKRPLAKDVRTVVVYATQPVGAVVGTFTLDGADIDTPAGLWRRHGHHGCIDRPAYDAYFQDRPAAVGLRVAGARRLTTPVPLSVVGATTAPQSFQYLPATALRALQPDSPRPPAPSPSGLAHLSRLTRFVAARVASGMRALTAL
jgi:predicted transcriptional regulator